MRSTVIAACWAAGSLAYTPSPGGPSRRAALRGIAASGAGALLPGGAAVAGPAAAAAATAALRRAALPSIGVGAWAWGDSLFWGYDPKLDDEIREVCEYCVKSGITLFDTAEVYGLGRSEELLRKYVVDSVDPAVKETAAKDVTIATKFAPLPWRQGRKAVVEAAKKSAARLGKDSIDLYQIHWPAAFGNEALWDGLGDCVDQGIVKAVGVSNYGASAMRGVHKALALRGIPLTSNQVQLSLTYPYPLENGIAAACKELDVTLLSYSPLGLGILTGKYSKDKLPSGPRAALAKEYFADPGFDALLATMGDVAAAHAAGTSLAQVAVAWTMAKGTVPIPGARNIRQAKENVAAAKLKLTGAEVAALDKASAGVKRVVTPEKGVFPKEAMDTKIELFTS